MAAVRDRARASVDYRLEKASQNKEVVEAITSSGSAPVDDRACMLGVFSAGAVGLKSGSDGNRVGQGLREQNGRRGVQHKWRIPSCKNGTPSVTILLLLWPSQR